MCAVCQKFPSLASSRYIKNGTIRQIGTTGIADAHQEGELVLEFRRVPRPERRGKLFGKRLGVEAAPVLVLFLVRDALQSGDDQSASCHARG